MLIHLAAVGGNEIVMLLLAIKLTELLHNPERVRILEIDHLDILLAPPFAFFIVRVGVDLYGPAFNSISSFACFFTDDFGIRKIKILRVVLRTALAGF
ncbi:hypothetical protein D3C73_1192160 [compost metagenome]